MNIRSTYQGARKEIGRYLTVGDYAYIISQFFKFVIDKVLEGHTVTLPSYMGQLKVVGRKHRVHVDENGKIRGMAIDWQKTKACNYEKTHYHFNDHTDNVTYKYLWYTTGFRIANANYYYLRLSRTNKRTLAHNVKAGKEYEILNPKPNGAVHKHKKNIHDTEQKLQV